MRIEVLGKNGFHPSEANKEYAIKKLQKLEQHFDDGKELEARVVFKVYSDSHKVETTILCKGFILRAECSDFDLYAAIDLSMDKLMSQIRKHKSKLQKHEKERFSSVVSEDFDVENLEKEIIASQLVRNKKVELMPMTVEEALTQMELLGHSFFIYLDSTTKKVNVLYLREDKNYAVIETSEKV